MMAMRNPKAFIDSQGYRQVWTLTGYILEHRLVMSEHLGRPFRSDELVHHINGDPADNHLENLKMTTFKEHPKIHFPKPIQEEILCACGCGKILQKFDDRGRSRRFIYGHQNRMKLRGISKEMPLRIDLPIDEVARRYGMGESTPEIAGDFGVTQKVIALRLRKAGIRLRSNSEAITLYQKRCGPLRR